ncbi:unnamed protein product [Trifolium pratense]|uniref:Uncharacterized protein n=1 Tax=Trifolium pratense TaxID=57577 RepID=A0ACB0JDS0_TRIPR|nr:unnamed protein product [Trifolium pratense]
MEMKIFVGLCFFFIILVIAEEAVVQNEACEKQSEWFTGDQCVGFIFSSLVCDYYCRDKDNLLHGTCINKKCICSC